MLNGKFYTGLTENQLKRSSGPNRQKTNFFWPDEKETSNKSTTNRLGQKRNSDVVRKYNETEEISRPKELFNKQLASKIQFNDATDGSITPPSIRRQNQKRELKQNLYEKNFHINDGPAKPKTFESKIEFYDFVETEKPKGTTAKVNSTKNVQEKKRISFDDTDDWDMTKKGILKNVDGGVSVQRNVPIDISEHRNFNKNNGSKLQLSQSMDNMVKSKLVMNDDYDRNDKVNGVTNQLNKLNIKNKEKLNISKRIDTRNDVDVEYNQKDYSKNSKYNIHPVRKNERQSRSDTSYSNLGWHNDKFETIEETHSKNYDDHTYIPRNSEQYIHNERSNLRKHLHTKNNTFNDRLQTNPINELHEEITKNVTTAPDNKRYQQERVVNIKRSSTINGANDYPNEARRRAHTHLQSNIFFQDDERLQQQRPLSIRESAVTRVGVGLPNM